MFFCEMRTNKKDYFSVFLFFCFFCIFAVSCFVCDIKASEHTANEKELFADVQIFNYQ